MKKAKGKVTFKKSSGGKAFKVNSKTGKVTVKKGTAAGKYTVKIVANVAKSASGEYAAASKKATVKVTVK